MSLDPDDPNWPALLSHPAEDGREEMALEGHLCGVSARARTVTPETVMTAGRNEGVQRSLREAAGVIGLAHDFGKASEWFQQHVGAVPGTPDDEPTHHSRLGALVTFYALRDRGFPPTTRFAGFVSVAKHHGNLPEAMDFLESVEADEQWSPGSAGYNYHAAKQAANIDCRVSEFAEAVFDELCEGGSWVDFRDRLVASVDPEDHHNLGVEALDEEVVTLRELLLADFYRVYGRRRKPRGTIASAEAYLDELRLFGALTFADKTHAAGIEDDDERLHAKPLRVDDIEGYIDDLAGTETEPEASLNDLRSAIQDRIRGQDGMDPVREFVESARNVATLSLPTGYGKTLTGLLAAARIREMTDGDRVVYALPFTSIVDQTAEVLADVTGESGTGRAFSIHHHLAETVTLSRDEDRAPSDEDETDERSREDVMVAKSWLAGVTLTTFVQLFESLAGPRNGQSMKLPALYDSIVVLDEPQALPLRWWPLVQRTLRVLVTEFDATVLLMTATQPRLLGEPKPFELLAGEDLEALEHAHFEVVPERVEYRFDPTALPASDADRNETVGYQDVANHISDAVLGRTDAALTICNTIDSAGELFETLTEALETITGREPVDAAREYDDLLGSIGAPATTDEAGDPSFPRRAFARFLAREAGASRPIVLHLTTRVRPCDRRFLLAVADDLTEYDVPFALVSTQLIEAGVDVSFDRVFRDFGPLDSIVQAAGRCNRSFERVPDKGTVTVWRLEPPSGASTPPSEAVYARASGSGEFDLLEVTRRALKTHVGGQEADETTVARDAVNTYHDEVGETVEAMAPDNDLLGYFEEANARSLRRASLIDRKLSYEVYVCRTEAELELAASVKELLATGQYEAVKQRRNRLAAIRVSIPVYNPASEVAQTLHKKLEPLTDDPSDAERILNATEETRRFDTSLGVRPLESGVEDRFF